MTPPIPTPATVQPPPTPTTHLVTPSPSADAATLEAELAAVPSAPSKLGAATLTPPPADPTPHP